MSNPTLQQGADIPVATPTPSRVLPAVTSLTAGNWGWLPLLSLVAALALLLIAFANTQARVGVAGVELFFWLGLLGLYAPVFLRLTGPNLARRERIGLVVLLGMALYLVKVLHSPIAFTFHDEFAHWRTANDIVSSGHLFNANPVIPASALYPGVEIATAALVQMSGLPIFTAGIVVLFLARLVLVLALFLFFERVGNSARVAGIATVLYMANPNFVFFLSQFSYESLALPIAVAVLYAAVRRSETSGYSNISLSLVMVVGLGAIITTHHLTSYAVVAFLGLWTAIFVYQSRHLDVRELGLAVLKWYAGDLSSRQLLQICKEQFAEISRRFSAHDNTDAKGDPGGLVLLVLVISLTWMVYVASLTIGYLAPVLTGAVYSLVNMIAGEATSRQLFQSSGGRVAPILERLTGLGSVILIMAGLYFGFRLIWSKYRSQAMLLALGTAALGYPVTLAFRLTSRGWELANRSSEFLFLALGLLLALVLVEVLRSSGARWSRPILVTCYAGVIFAGGVIAGWPPAWRQPGPYLPAAITRSIEPQVILAATWARDTLGEGNHVVADQANTLVMSSFGEQWTMSTLSGGIDSDWILFAPKIGETQDGMLKRGEVQYVVVDQRLVGAPEIGRIYYPNADINQALAKFDTLAHTSRIFDSGDIQIYDVGAFLREP